MGNIGCVCIFVIINSSAMKIGVYTSSQVSTFAVFRYVPRSGISRSCGCSIFSYLRKCLQDSCMENPMDGEAWWATVHGVAKSWTRLSDFTSLHTVFYSGYTKLHSYQQCRRISFFSQPRQHLLLMFFLVMGILTGMRWYLRWFSFSIPWWLVDTPERLNYRSCLYSVNLIRGISMGIRKLPEVSSSESHVGS